MLKFYMIFDESPISIAICPSNKENFINSYVANQVQVQESMKNKSNKDQIEVPLQIGDYHFSAQFTIAAIDDQLIDIMLGYSWLETLGTFFVNATKKYIIFFHEKKKIML